MTSAPAIGFEYRPSRWLSRVLCLVSALATLAVWICALPWLVKLTLSLAIGLALGLILMRWSGVAVRAAGWGRDGGWSLRWRDEQDSAATLASYRVIGTQAVWLRLSLAGRGRVALLLAPDNSDADIRRRLRMRLAQQASGTLAAERGPTV